MGFILLVFLSALILEGLGSYISILGLASNTSIIVILVVMALDFAKIIMASALYKKWSRLSFFLKLYLIPALLFLMIITSFGAFGFLSKEFSQTILQQEKTSSQLEILEKEQVKLEARKIEVDRQISQLPSEQVTQRRKLSDLFAPEMERIQSRIAFLDSEIPKLKVGNIQESGSNGTIGAVSKTLKTTPEYIINLVSFLIVLVIDPLAIVLLTIGNFLIDEHKKDRKKVVLLEEVTQDSLSSDTLSPLTQDDDGNDSINNSVVRSVKKKNRKEKGIIASDDNKPIDKMTVNISTDGSHKTEKQIKESVSISNEILTTEGQIDRALLEISNPLVVEKHGSQKENNLEFTNSSTLGKYQLISNIDTKENNDSFERYVKNENNILTFEVIQHREGISLNSKSQPFFNPSNSIIKKDPLIKQHEINFDQNSKLSEKKENILPEEIKKSNKFVGKYDFKSYKNKNATQGGVTTQPNDIHDNSDLAAMEQYIKEKQSSINKPLYEEDSLPL